MSKTFRTTLLLLMVASLVTTGCFRRKKYENPITKDTQQPDKVLFDKAINDIEKGRYEVARITLNTLMNTYDSSEYLAKAKLAIADSWVREGGSNGLAQAEAEYKDFILFYPSMEEAAEAQQKVCDIHYKQMEKPDRDDRHAYKAEEECRLLLTQWPNSRFAPSASQRLRNIQEVLAEKEYRVGHYYVTKGSNAAAANRLKGVTDQYPLFSKSDVALWEQADAYTKMGPRFKAQAGEALQKLVRDYPLSPLKEQAMKRLKDMEVEVPEADPVAIARMKYEAENATKTGMMHPFWGIFKKSPDTTMAAKSGTPAMSTLKPGIPVSVPVPTTGTGVNEVGGTVLSGQSDLDTKPDARQSVQNAQQGAQGTPQGAQQGTGTATAAPAAGTEGSAAAPAAAKPEADPKQKGKKEKKPKK